MQLYFRNSQNKERLIAECKTIQEMNAAIKQFLQEYNFKSYYTRIWYEPEGTETPLYTRTKGRFIYDFGSHFEFIEAGLPFKKFSYRDFILRFGGKQLSTRRWFKVRWNWLNRLLIRIYV